MSSFICSYGPLGDERRRSSGRSGGTPPSRSRPRRPPSPASAIPMLIARSGCRRSRAVRYRLADLGEHERHPWVFVEQGARRPRERGPHRRPSPLPWGMSATTATGVRSWRRRGGPSRARPVVPVDRGDVPPERAEPRLPRRHSGRRAVVVDHEHREVAEPQVRRQEHRLPVRALVHLGVARRGRSSRGSCAPLARSASAIPTAIASRARATRSTPRSRAPASGPGASRADRRAP